MLNRFQGVDEVSFSNLQQTRLPLPVLQATLQQLAQHSLLRVPSVLEDSSIIQFNVDVTFADSVVNLVPETSLQLHATSSSNMTELVVVSDARIDAAIVRIMKKKKFMKADELAAEIAAFLSFVPDVRVFVREFIVEYGVKRPN